MLLLPLQLTFMNNSAYFNINFYTIFCILTTSSTNLESPKHLCFLSMLEIETPTHHLLFLNKNSNKLAY